MSTKSIYRGDTWKFEYQILDSNKNPIDVTHWEIRAEIVNKNNKSIRKANDKVSGGSVDQIKVLDNKGNIEIKFKPEETKELNHGNVTLEVEITLPSYDLKYTVVKERFFVNDDIIDWTDK